MPTERLYWKDSFLWSFEAKVVGHATLGERPAVLLDATAFYPESGGQMADHGTLGDASVVDVQYLEPDVIAHAIEGELPAVGTTVEGQIDGPRRRLFMALHTGQHMFSRALVDVMKAPTVSSRLGESECTLDVDVKKLDPKALEAAEALVNQTIEDDIPVTALFPTADELAQLPLRRVPKVDEDIRVLRIGDFDYTPCGGTHCTNTAQVGMLRVLGVEKRKGRPRIHFSAGRRAMDGLRAEAAALAGLGKDFTCGPLDVPDSVAKQSKDLKAAARQIDALQKVAAEALTERLAKEDSPVIHRLDFGGGGLLRKLGPALATADRVVLLAALEQDELRIMAARGPDSAFDCGGFIRRTTQAAGGKGGGRPDRAEGRVPGDTDWETLARKTFEDS